MYDVLHKPTLNEVIEKINIKKCIKLLPHLKKSTRRFEYFKKV